MLSKFGFKYKTEFATLIKVKLIYYLCVNLSILSFVKSFTEAFCVRLYFVNYGDIRTKLERKYNYSASEGQ